MFRTRNAQQLSYEFVNIGGLVPKGHLLHKIAKYIDFGFIVEKTKGLYCEDNGRPCIDPIILFKMLFIGYIYGIRSEHRLVEEIKVNIAYRWFLGLSLSDPTAFYFFTALQFLSLVILLPKHHYLLFQSKANNVKLGGGSQHSPNRLGAFFVFRSCSAVR